MKKKYTYPTIEILPFCAVNALCGSGGGGTNEDMYNGGGADPWTGGMAPQRTAVF